MLSKLKRVAFQIAKPVVMPSTKKKLSHFYKRELSLTPFQGGGRRIVFLAPHVDDETIGAGGTIIRHVQEGDDVTVVFMTDGAKSVSQLDKDQLIAERKKEANIVKKVLGFQEMMFLDLPDGEVVSNSETQRLLTDIIDEVKPDMLYCPTFVDCHPDHVATAQLVADVMGKREDHPIIRLYEINCPIPPNEINTIIDITQQLDKKNTAIDIFSSQSIDFDGFVELSYIKASLLKNRKETKAVETFLEIPGSRFHHDFYAIANEKTPYSQMFKQVNKATTLVWGITKNYPLKAGLYQKRKEE